MGGPDGKISGWSWPKVKCFPVRPDLNQSISIFYHMTVVLFSDRAKTRSRQHLPRFARAFLAGTYAFFSALLLIWSARPSELFFHMLFQRNCARGRTYHMIKCDESRDSTDLGLVRICLGLQAIFRYYLTFNEQATYFSLFFVRKGFKFLCKNFSIKNESCPRWVEPPTSIF